MLNKNSCVLTRNKIIPYKPYLKKLARELRKNSTIAEILLWEQIKMRQLGFQFHRQVPMDQYIVDFYCHELMLAIEVDGATHDNEEGLTMDQNRQLKLEKYGVKFLRFDDVDVKHSLANVVEAIKDYIIQLGHPPSPPSRGEAP
jgi:very-short-patch-repair endonuclease